MQTRGSSRAGQLQCGLRRRGAGSSRRAGRRRQAQAGGVPRIARGLYTTTFTAEASCKGHPFHRQSFHFDIRGQTANGWSDFE